MTLNYTISFFFWGGGGGDSRDFQFHPTGRVLTDIIVSGHLAAKCDIVFTEKVKQEVNFMVQY